MEEIKDIIDKLVFDRKNIILKMKCVLLSLVFLNSVAFSQTIIKGKVIDQGDQHPLIGAMVQLQKVKKGLLQMKEGILS